MTEWAPTVDDVVGRLPYASNATLLARTTDGDLVVYKPEDGERPLWDFPYGTLAAREALTFEISDAAGLDVVPETVLAEGPYGRGSLQRFVIEDQTFNPAPMINDGDAALWPTAVLDLVVNNADRKAGHILKEQDSDRLWSIDHGVTLHDEPKHRTVLWVFAGCPFPTPMISALERLAAALEGGLAERVSRLLSFEEAHALAARVAGLLRHPVHPDPPLDRPAVPWPLY